MARRLRMVQIAACAAGMLAVATADAAPPPDGLHWTPKVGWRSGEHSIDLSASTRWRYENWDARAASESNMVGGRTRVAAKYSWRDRLALLAEGQYVYTVNHKAGSSGAAGLYRAFSKSGNSSSTSAVHLTKAWAEISPVEGLKLVGGRQAMNIGTLLTYPEANWKWLKVKRLSQRLVGTVDWTNVGRAYDGGSVVYEAGGYFAHGYVAQPTTGVFENDDGYEPNSGILVGGIEATAARGTWLANTELTAFFVGYGDDRDPSTTAGLFGELEVYTLGANLVGIYPIGPGNVDALLWVAGQFGSYFTSATNEQAQLAWGLLAEFGYQFTELPMKPWLRTGVNVASGDSSPGDGHHGSFYNVMPTNHLYYGYADQLAFSNLVDWFAQLKLTPLPKVGFEFVVHRFWLYSAADARYFGTGAFDKNTLGFGAAPSTGSADIGTELDVVVSYQITPHLGLAGGFAYLFGGNAFRASSDPDTQWGFLQLTLAY